MKLASIIALVAMTITSTSAFAARVDPDAVPRQLIRELCSELYNAMPSLDEEAQNTILTIAQGTCDRYHMQNKESLGKGVICARMLKRLNEPFDQHALKIELANSFRMICVAPQP